LKSEIGIIIFKILKSFIILSLLFKAPLGDLGVDFKRFSDVLGYN